MIHETAIVDPGARLHESVEVGPWSLIGPNVEIGEGARVGASSVVLADVPPHVSVAGVPSKILGSFEDEPTPSLGMDHTLASMKEYESGGGI